VTTCDVAVVGFGPVGATLANLLGRDGVSVVVLEQATDVYQLPRAAHFDGEVMRIFQSVGLSDQILPATASMPGMDFVAADGRLLLRFEAADHEAHDGWSRTFMFHQPDLERALWRGVDRFPSVRTCLGTEVTAIAEDAEGVTVSGRDLTSGAAVEVRARYLVGCDGARSTLRRHAGIALDDLRFDQPWLVLDTVLRDGAEPALPDRAIQYCDPARPATFVPSAGRHRRWEFMLLDGEDPAAIEEPETVSHLLSPWVEVGRDVDVIRSAVYRFHALVAERWRAGRLVLAGDACHQMPPFLGQGMCSGIRDAANLAWKLGLVLDGIAGDEVLDTYQPEREPHVRTIARLAVEMGGIISTTDREVAAARDASMSADRPAAQPELPRAELTFRHGDHDLVGRRWPQPRIGDDEALGHRFALVGDAATDVEVDHSLEGWVRVADVDPGPLPSGTVALLRPDRFVAAAGHPADVTHALRSLLTTKGTP
jgi:3-(3-hydroxy-phenyl)propionate hydroxylase